MPITRLLNGSRKRPLTTRGEYWLDASWIVSSDTENAMPATVIVAPATVLSTARALSTVEVSPSGSVVRPAPSAASSAMPELSRARSRRSRRSSARRTGFPRTRSANADRPIFIGCGPSVGTAPPGVTGAARDARPRSSRSPGARRSRSASRCRHHRRLALTAAIARSRTIRFSCCVDADQYRISMSTVDAASSTSSASTGSDPVDTVDVPETASTASARASSRSVSYATPTTKLVRRCGRGRLDVHGALVDVGIRDEDPLTIEGGDHRLADRDPLDGPLVLADPDLVAPGERLAEQQQDPREEVLEDVLEREADRDREEPEAGEQVDRLDRGEGHREREEHADAW